MEQYLHKNEILLASSENYITNITISSTTMIPLITITVQANGRVNETYHRSLLTLPEVFEIKKAHYQAGRPVQDPNHYFQ